MAIKKRKRLLIPEPFPFDPEEPLKRIPTKSGEYLGESNAGVAALTDYCQMGVRRSLRVLVARYQKQAENEDTTSEPPPTQYWNTIARWSFVYAWGKRAEIYDAQQAEILARELLARQLDIRERDYEQANAMRKLADEILEAAPDFVARKTVEDKATKWTTEYLSLDGNLLVKLAEAGSKMARLSADMASKRTAIQIDTDFLESLPDDVLELIIDGKISQEELITLARDLAKGK